MKFKIVLVIVLTISTTFSANADLSSKADSTRTPVYKVPLTELDKACSGLKESDRTECLTFIKTIKKDQANQDVKGKNCQACANNLLIPKNVK